MKDVRRKSGDPAVNTLLIKAYRQQDEVIWDRMEAMQPQDGFGLLGLSCTHCYEGPCRVNPFDALDQETACGMDRHDLAANTLICRVQNGASALLRLALDRKAAVSGSACKAACLAGDVMPCRDGLAASLAQAGHSIGGLLDALSSVRQPSGATRRLVVNMGALRADAANIMVIGHALPSAVASLMKAASAGTEAVNMLGVCGGEDLDLPLLTNYDSQELPLLTGAVDLVVYGSQCVMPATLRLAGRLGIPVWCAADEPDAGAVNTALNNALAHFRKRGPRADIPVNTEQATVWHGDLPPDMIEAVRAGCAAGTSKGLVYLGGCGNVRHTQDAELVALAKALLAEGYVVVSSGCVGTALAKAGLCNPDHGSVPGLPDTVAPVLHLGTCHNIRGILEFAASGAVPVYAVMPELTQSKTLATAVALGTAGIPVFVSATAMPGLDARDTGNVLHPVEDFADFAQTLARTAEHHR